MIEVSFYVLVIIMAVAFVAGYIDAVAGGGGMLNLPTLLFFGLPPVTVLAINKVAGFAGTVLAVIKFSLNKSINWKLVVTTIVPCFLASYLGGKLALNLSSEVLNWAILLCIPVALFVVVRSVEKPRNNSDEVPINKALLAVVPFGFYDGLLGPGTGTYMAIAVKNTLNFDYLKATASIKPLNLITNLGALLAFLFAGKVVWAIALPMALSSAAGGWAGSHFAIKNGSKFIKKLLVVVLILMLIANIIKLFYEQ